MDKDFYPTVTSTSVLKESQILLISTKIMLSLEDLVCLFQCEILNIHITIR